MKTTIILSVISLVTLANCLPHKPVSFTTSLDCEPSDGWQLIYHRLTGFGDETDEYTMTVGTHVEGDLSEEETNALFELFAEKLGELKSCISCCYFFAKHHHN